MIQKAYLYKNIMSSNKKIKNIKRRLFFFANEGKANKNYFKYWKRIHIKFAKIG